MDNLNDIFGHAGILVNEFFLVMMMIAVKQRKKKISFRGFLEKMRILMTMKMEEFDESSTVEEVWWYRFFAENSFSKMRIKMMKKLNLKI